MPQIPRFVFTAATLLLVTALAQNLGFGPQLRLHSERDITTQPESEHGTVQNMTDNAHASASTSKVYLLLALPLFGLVLVSSNFNCLGQKFGDLDSIFFPLLLAAAVLPFTLWSSMSWSLDDDWLGIIMYFMFCYFPLQRCQIIADRKKCHMAFLSSSNTEVGINGTVFSSKGGCILFGGPALADNSSFWQKFRGTQRNVDTVNEFVIPVKTPTQEEPNKITNRLGDLIVTGDSVTTRIRLEFSMTRKYKGSIQISLLQFEKINEIRLTENGISCLYIGGLTETTPWQENPQPESEYSFNERQFESHLTAGNFAEWHEYLAYLDAKQKWCVSLLEHEKRRTDNH